MINLKALCAAIVLAAAVATPAFAKEHGRAYDRYRGAYNQLGVPHDTPVNGFGFGETDPSPTGRGTWLHPSDLNPSGS
jgi:hypothetical protein